MSIKVTLRGAIESLQYERHRLSEALADYPYGQVAPRIDALNAIIGQLVIVECELEDAMGLHEQASAQHAELRDAPPAASEESGDQIEASSLQTEETTAASFGGDNQGEVHEPPPGGVEESRDISFADFQKIAERMTSERRLMRMKEALNSSDQQTEKSALGYSSGNDQGDGLEALPGGVEESRDQIVTLTDAEEFPQDAVIHMGNPPVTAEDFTLLDPAVLRDEPEIPEGFTKWEGGYCPLEIGTEAEVLTRKCGTWHVTIKPEAPLLWEHEGHDLDIVGYRIIYTKAEPGTQHGVEAITIAPHVYTEGGHSITHEQPITVFAERADEPEGYAPVVDAEPVLDAGGEVTAQQSEVDRWIKFGEDTPDDERKAVREGFLAQRAGVQRDSSHMREDLRFSWRYGYDVAADPTGIGPEMGTPYGSEPDAPAPYAEAVQKGAITQDEADLLAAAKAELEEGSTARMFAQGMMADADRHQSDQRSIVEKIGGLFKREREDA